MLNRWYALGFAVVISAPLLFQAQPHGAIPRVNETASATAAPEALSVTQRPTFSADQEEISLKKALLETPVVDDKGTVRLIDQSGLEVAVAGPSATLSSNQMEPITVSLEGVGRDEDLNGILRTQSPEIVGQVAWQEYQVAGTTIEEYWRVDEGIEHGYLVHEKPSGSGPLEFALKLDGATASGNSDEITVSSPDGAALLNWAQLKTWDATGRVLTAGFEILNEHVRIVVDDSDATYPILVDPTFSQVAYLKASNPGNSDFFGGLGFGFDSPRAVAIDGDIAVVGAPYEDSNGTSESDNTALNSGAAYVFEKVSGVWTQTAYLKQSTPTSFQNFGFSVDVSGETVAVGAPGSSGNRGYFGVFVKSGSSWVLQHERTVAESMYGSSVAVDGDLLAVGTSNGDNYDSVYVFSRSGTTWSSSFYSFTGSNTASNDSFGTALDLAGNTLVVGAPYEDSDRGGVVNGTTHGSSDNDNAGNAGAAYVFVFDGSAWEQQAYLKAGVPEGTTGATCAPSSFSDGTADHFGMTVAISGDTIVVGAPGENSAATEINGDETSNSACDSGAAYVFTRDGSTWSRQAFLKPSNNYVGYPSWYFGSGVGVSGDTVVVGAQFEESPGRGIDADDTPSEGNSYGAAYAFSRTGSSWSQSGYIKPSNLDEDDDFGSSVAVSQNAFIVAARSEFSASISDESDNSEDQAGAAYIFSITPDAAAPAPQAVTSTPRSSKPSGNPGIFLTLTGSVGELVGRQVTRFGAYSAGSRGLYSVVLKRDGSSSPRVVLDSGRLNNTGNLESEIRLPELSAGTYTVTYVAQGASGELLTLANRFSVSPTGRLLSLTPEALQPRTR